MVRKRWWLAGIAILFGVLMLVVWQVQPPAPLPPLPEDVRFSRAAWLGVTWAMDPHSDSEIAALASEEWTLSHHLTAETLNNTLYGWRAGLAAVDYDTIDGFALYPYWETDQHEWAAVDALP